MDGEWEGEIRLLVRLELWAERSAAYMSLHPLTRTSRTRCPAQIARRGPPEHGQSSCGHGDARGSMRIICSGHLLILSPHWVLKQAH